VYTNDAPEVLVIGAGQAGLVMGYQLAQRGLSFQIVDAGAQVGAAWRRRWDSLRLFTAAQYDNLPGMAFPAASDTYPGKDDVADFLRAYTDEFELPVRLNTKVSSLTKSQDGYVASADDERFEAKHVVVATGPFQVPFVPPIASDFDPDVTQVHSADYRNPEDLAPGRVLVVGAANSGCQIALELSATRAVELSAGERIPTIPQRPLGRDVWWWGTTLGLTRVTVDSRLGKRLAGRDQVIGGGLRELRRRGVAVRPRAASATGRTVTFADGACADYDVVVWATGFEVDHSWIDVAGVARDERGQVLHERGVTSSPGLHVLGLTWQHTRTSALLGWVGEDAAFLAEHIAESNASSQREPEAALAKAGR
jgi:putative flavoprotein involved in K+ transport